MDSKTKKQLLELKKEIDPKLFNEFDYEDPANVIRAALNSGINVGAELINKFLPDLNLNTTSDKIPMVSKGDREEQFQNLPENMALNFSGGIKSKDYAKMLGLNLEEVTNIVKKYGEKPLKDVANVLSAQEASTLRQIHNAGNIEAKGYQQAADYVDALDKVYGSVPVRKFEPPQMMPGTNQATQVVKNTAEELLNTNPAFQQQIMSDALNTVNNTTQAARKVIKGTGAPRNPNAAFDPRFKNTGGKGTEFAGIAAIPAAGLLMNPDQQPEQPLEGYAEGGMIHDMPAFDQTMDIQQDRLPAFDQTEDVSKYETPGQLALTAVEGVAEGLAGPLAPLLQTELGQNPDDIRARAALNPITKGVGEATGLGIGMFTGTGEAAVMSKAGQAITKAAGLAEKTSTIGKIGSKIVQEAVENMVQQGSDEISKVILKDPEASMQSAIGNIGLAGVLGGTLGGAMGGVSELWKNTAGKKLDTTLNTMYDRMSGKTLFLPEELEASMKAIGVDSDPLLRAAVSKDPNLVNKFNVLKEVQNSEVLASIDNAHKQAEKAVLETLGVDPNEMMYYSRSEAGNDLLETFKKEYDAKYKPFAKEFEKRDALAQEIKLSDDAKLNHYTKILEDGVSKIGTDSPYYKTYQHYADRIMAKDTVGGLDKLKTEINDKIKGLKVGGDYNEINALKTIKDSITELQENEIIKQIRDISDPYVANKIIDERNLLNKQYRDFANMSDELTTHLGVGDFYGAKTLENKLTDKLSAEQLLNKFSIKNNADFIPFLQQNFPETLNKVKQAEFKEFVKPAFLSAKEGQEINVKKLSDLIDKGLAGKKEYVESLISPNTMSMVKSATDVLNGIPNPKSSGTAGWMTKVFDKMPQSALAGAAALMGQNPLLGYLAGEVAQATGRNIPDAIRLAYLKFMASDKPVQSTAFKAMVEAIHDTYKFENKLSKATKNLFDASTKTVINDIPDQESRDKLVKKLKKLEENPNALMDKLGNSDLAHYMPEHQAALASNATSAVEYLQALKPQPYKPTVLDKPIEPSEAEKQRYYRALDIAQNPLVVLQHIKEGTLQTSDIQDLTSMYPYLYNKYVNNITNEIASLEGADKQMPYKQRISTSLFLGQPLDMTMLPNSILSAQAVHMQKHANQPNNNGFNKDLSKLGKSNSNFLTPLQKSELNKSK
jgi:hypothetical protein